MRAVHNARYGYIYNAFSNGTYWYRNNNEGQTMAAMNLAAKTDPAVAARVNLFRYRVPEEFYDLEKDPDCLVNLIDSPRHKETIKGLQSKLVAQMKKTNDPMLKAFENRTDRAIVDQVMVATYGPQKPSDPKKPRNKQDKKGKKNKKEKN
jgi:N-sulfoglucosamine sulfohydrolase